MRMFAEVWTRRVKIYDKKLLIIYLSGMSICRETDFSNVTFMQYDINKEVIR